MTPVSRFRTSALFALLSFPFWFLTSRFSKELGFRHRTPNINPDTEEALLVALLGVVFVFCVSLYATRKQSR